MAITIIYNLQIFLFGIDHQLTCVSWHGAFTAPTPGKSVTFDVDGYFSTFNAHIAP
jgi:hypothetical protein